MVDFSKKKVTVMGLGLHGGGLAVAKWLLRAGARVCVTDLKTETELEKSVAELKKEARHLKKEKFLTLHLGRHQADDFSQADIVIKNPAVPRASKWLELARKNNVVIHNEASLFFLLAQSPIIAVTGSKGKSTTTALLGTIWQKAFPGTLVAGNIRTTPMFAIVDSARGPNKAPYVILELSSWQLEMMETVKKSPQTAVITNIYPEHLNTYDSIDDYFKAKLEIANYQEENDNLVLNFSDNRLRSFGESGVKQKIFWFNLSSGRVNGVEVGKDFFIWHKDGRKDNILKVKDVPLVGEHNLANVAAAVCTAKIYNIDNRIIKEAVLNFSPLEGRRELVGEIAGRKFYNDTTATAPVATVATLNSFAQKVILIAGGADKDLPLGELAKAIIAKTKKVVLLPGRGTDRLVSEFKKNNFFNYQIKDSMLAAVKEAYNDSVPGDIILLSPGFASFGLFMHEFDRGHKFLKAVKSLND